MKHTMLRRLIAGAGAAVLLLACSTAPAEQQVTEQQITEHQGAAHRSAAPAPPAPPTTPAPPTPTVIRTFGLLGADAPSSYSCTEIGNAEFVGVDLSQVLPLEGGGYYAEVSVPSLGVSSTQGFAGNDGYYPSGSVEADLGGGPVEVRVRVVTERGDVAYETSDTARPTLHQPNGARCDGENHTISLVATESGELLPRGDRWYVTDDRGRRSEALDTRCGVERLSDGLREWRRVGGSLDDGAGGPPPGWNAPAQRGWVTAQGDGSVLFEDERGHSERFEPATDGWYPAGCG